MNDNVGRISEAWSPQSRVAAEEARRRHRHAPTDTVRRFAANLHAEARREGDKVPESVRRATHGLPLTSQHVEDLHGYAREAEGAEDAVADLERHPRKRGKRSGRESAQQADRRRNQASGAR